MMAAAMTSSEYIMQLHQRGFSYVWTLLVVAGIAVSSTLAIEVGVTATRRDKEKELIAIGRQFRIALARYHAASPNGAISAYPQSLEQLLRDDRVPGIRRHLRKIFVDPMTGKAEWGLMRVGGRIVGVYSLSEQIPIKQDGFQAEEVYFRGKQRYTEWVFAYPANALLQTEIGPSRGLLQPSPASPGNGIMMTEPLRKRR
ncbi:MAG: type II secretion system protein [Candidatus Accumulibacter sp.]|jgi:type II secretory pathway pseudopilin PulG|nr:type II secretion system protein [Accumulibacter sp.]